MALCSEVCEVKYLRSLMRELGLNQVESTLIWEDNKAAILIAENECSSAGRKGGVCCLLVLNLVSSTPTLTCDTSSWRRLLRKDQSG